MKSAGKAMRFIHDDEQLSRVFEMLDAASAGAELGFDFVGPKYWQEQQAKMLVDRLKDMPDVTYTQREEGPDSFFRGDLSPCGYVRIIVKKAATGQ